MATTKIWPIKSGSSIKQVIEYVENENKTTYKYRLVTEKQDLYNEQELSTMEDVIGYAAKEYKTAEQKLVSTLNCTISNARDEMMATKERYGKEGGIILWHGYQSFKPGEVTPEEAHKIGVELANTLWREHEVVIATHIDRKHIHNHFVINSVSLVNGNKLDGKWQEMKTVSDRLCREHGKSIVENPKYNSKHYAEYMASKNGQVTWIGIIQDDIEDAIGLSSNFEEFLYQMKLKKYDYDFSGKYFKLRPPGKERWVRIDRRLGDDYTISGIEKKIERNRGKIRFVPDTRRYYCRSHPPKPKKSISGYQALYYKYLYKMGVLPRRSDAAARRNNFIFREEILNMNKISESIRLMRRYDINTEADLFYNRYIWKDRLRSCINAQKKTRNSLRSNPDNQVLKDKLKSLNSEVSKLRKNLNLLEDIEKRSIKMHEKQEMIKEKEGKENARTTRSRDDG